MICGELGVLTDDARGMHSTQNIYSDLDIEKIETLPPTQPHRDVDLALVEADEQGKRPCCPRVPNPLWAHHGPWQDMSKHISSSPAPYTA